MLCIGKAHINRYTGVNSATSYTGNKPYLVSVRAEHLAGVDNTMAGLTEGQYRKNSSACVSVLFKQWPINFGKSFNLVSTSENKRVKGFLTHFQCRGGKNKCFRARLVASLSLHLSTIQPHTTGPENLADENRSDFHIPLSLAQKTVVSRLDDIVGGEPPCSIREIRSVTPGTFTFSPFIIGGWAAATRWIVRLFLFGVWIQYLVVIKITFHKESGWQGVLWWHGKRGKVPEYEYSLDLGVYVDKPD